MSGLNRINTQQNFPNPNFINFSSFIQPINSNPVFNYIYNMNLNRIFPSPINLNQIHNFNNNITKNNQSLQILKLLEGLSKTNSKKNVELNKVN